MEGNLIACEMSEVPSLLFLTRHLHTITHIPIIAMLIHRVQKETPSSSSPVGVIQLYNAKVMDVDPATLHPTVTEASDTMHMFQVVSQTGKSWFLAAADAKEKGAWRSALEYG